MNLYMRPSVRQLEYLVTLAETLNFRQAANRLNVTQPSLSNQIKELEERLGTKLFERSTRNVKLTPTGRAITDQARIILQDIDYLGETAERAGQNLGGIIHLGVPPTIGPYILPYLIPQLHKAYPDLKLHVSEAPPRDLELGLDAGEYDLLLTVTPVLLADLATMPILEERLFVGMSKDNDLAKEEKIFSSSLAGQQVLTLGKGHQLFEQSQYLAEQCKCVLMTDYQGTSLDALRHMVLIDMGIAFFPELYATAEVSNDDSIVLKPFEDIDATRTIGLVWRRTSPRIKDFHEVSDVLKKVVKSIQTNT